MSIRSTAKAIILHNGQVLLNKCIDAKNGTYYTLPGGGQEAYETLADTIIRECREETGYCVTPIRFAALMEEICDDVDFRQQHPEYAHKMLHIFLCGLSDAPVVKPTVSDDAQVGIEWMNVASLPRVKLLPKALGEHINQLIAIDAPMFLGSVHIPFNHG